MYVRTIEIIKKKKKCRIRTDYFDSYTIEIHFKIRLNENTILINIRGLIGDFLFSVKNS